MNGANEIYNSRNYYGIIACKVTTFIPNHIYNSRNYYGIIATYFMQIYVKYSKLKRCMSIFFRFLTHLTIEYIFDF